MTWPTPQADYRIYNEAVKDLQAESIVELQRLASKMPDHLLVGYPILLIDVGDLTTMGLQNRKYMIN